MSVQHLRKQLRRPPEDVPISSRSVPIYIQLFRRPETIKNEPSLCDSGGGWSSVQEILMCERKKSFQECEYDFTVLRDQLFVFINNINKPGI